ncbi:MAG: hypothetical protein QM687_02555 [Ferruginibacter sp.]
MKLTKLFAAFTFMMVVAFSASAQSNTQRSDARKIRQGVHSGELTKAETYKLTKQQYALRKDIRQAKSDGVVTCAERKDIRIDKKKADANIYRKKHNDRDRN